MPCLWFPSCVVTYLWCVHVPMCSPLQADMEPDQIRSEMTSCSSNTRKRTHFQVLTRGSQYRVEAVMQRILKARNFIAISPTRNQVGTLPVCARAYTHMLMRSFGD